MNEKIKQTTYNLVTVIKLQHHIRRVVCNGLWVSVDFNVLKDESLIPCGVEGCPYDFCGLTHVKEWDMGVWIWGGLGNKFEGLWGRMSNVAFTLAKYHILITFKTSPLVQAYTGSVSFTTS